MPDERRTAQDYPAQLRSLVNTVYPDSHVIRLVQDNPNTYGPVALCGAFPPAEAYQLRQRFEFHPMPKRGSWLSMAEIEISILARRCLSRACCPDLDMLRHRATLEAERNAAQRAITWQVTMV